MIEEPGILVDVCICTFRRPHLAETLRCIAQQIAPPVVKVRGIVADNDFEQSARPVVFGAAAEHRMDIGYIHAPARNISVARNACLDYSKADWIAFLDDDEVVSPHWLCSLLNASQGADVIFGPVNARYDEMTADWIKRGNFHSAQVVFESGQIRTGYAGNVLMRRSAVEKVGLRFDLEHGLKGGEDTHFFGALFDAGLRLSYAPKAMAEEYVPLDRQSLSWLAKRSFRSGRSHASMLLNRNRKLRPFRVVLSLAKSSICCLGIAGNLWSAFLWRKWLLRSAMHAGMTSRFVGL